MLVYQAPIRWRLLVAICLISSAHMTPFAACCCATGKRMGTGPVGRAVTMFAPFCGVVVAGCTNLLCMRNDEIRKGVIIRDPSGVQTHSCAHEFSVPSRQISLVLSLSFYIHVHVGASNVCCFGYHVAYRVLQQGMKLGCRTTRRMRGLQCAVPLDYFGISRSSV